MCHRENINLYINPVVLHTQTQTQKVGLLIHTKPPLIFQRALLLMDICFAPCVTGALVLDLNWLTFWLPVDFTDGGGTAVPLSGGLVGFEALRCYAEECAFSLSTQAQDHVWDLAEYKRVEPAHCPTGATSGGTECERNLLWAYHPLFLRTRLVICMTGVL